MKKELNLTSASTNRQDLKLNTFSHRQRKRASKNSAVLEKSVNQESRIYSITANAVYRFLRRDWRIVFDQDKIQKTKLEDLGFSSSEVNWLLNSLEWKYCIEIETENVSPKSTLEEFVRLVVAHQAHYFNDQRIRTLRVV